MWSGSSDDARESTHIYTIYHFHGCSTKRPHRENQDHSGAEYCSLLAALN
jgi:hypothetical protein